MAQRIANSFVEGTATSRELLALGRRPQAVRHDHDVLRLVDLDRLTEDAARAEIARTDEPPLIAVTRHRRRRRGRVLDPVLWQHRRAIRQHAFAKCEQTDATVVT